MNKAVLSGILLVLSIQMLGAEATLKERWSTASDFKVPESVFFDPEAECLYVSNINGGPSQKNGEGFLSKVDISGRILELEWVTGLNAPKGMGVYSEKLYVTDVDRIAVIDKNRGTVLTFYSAPGAKFLNDIAVDPKGRVFISDSSGDAIYALEGERIAKVLSGGRYLKSPNGLFWEGDALLIGVQGRILRWKPDEEELTVLVETTGGIDGLQPTGAGDYLISDWSGVVRLVSAPEEEQILMDVKGKKANTADFCYIPEKNLLVIPTFSGNQLWSFELVR
jgi:DNA-binding beta-propeller fold protein YncE